MKPTSVTEEHPWHETFWAQLVTALHRSGRRADALRTYRIVHDRFVEELGIEPGTRLRQAQQDALGAEAGEPARPAVVAQSAGVTRTGSHRPRRCHRAPGRVRGDPRRQPQHRDLGAPGVGKTTLAVHVAHRWRALFPDGQLYVNLQGFAADPPLSPSMALTRVLVSLGSRPRPGARGRGGAVSTAAQHADRPPDGARARQRGRRGPGPAAAARSARLCRADHQPARPAGSRRQSGRHRVPARRARRRRIAGRARRPHRTRPRHRGGPRARRARQDLRAPAARVADRGREPRRRPRLQRHRLHHRAHHPRPG